MEILSESHCGNFLNLSMQTQSAKGHTVNKTTETNGIEHERFTADLLVFSCELIFTVPRSLESHHCIHLKKSTFLQEHLTFYTPSFHFTFCLFWRMQTAMCCWWLRSYVALLNLWAPAYQEEQEFGTIDSVSWTCGVTFISLLDTCKAHSLYFSVLSGWRNKVIKDTDDLKQARVQKNAKKTILKCCD